MSIFNKNFFPTPESLIKKLLKPYEIANHRYWDYEISGNILEPSAGKGDIAKFIQDKTKTKIPPFL